MINPIFIKALFEILILASAFGCHSQFHFQQEDSGRGTRDAAVETLRRYLDLRLQDAHWKEYSQFITWPDEPAWDCKWVINHYSLSAAEKQHEKAVIPVVYNRLGLICDYIHFEPDQKVITISYELVMSPNGWKIDSPVPDYPEIDVRALLRSLNTAAGNTSLTPELREEAEATVRKIMEAIKQDSPAETPLLLPQELLEIAGDRGCTQIEDFFDRPGMIEPPFAYGYMTGSKENSAAFWCQENGKKQYYLMIMNKKKAPQEMSCPKIIPWKNYPGGLSIFSGSRVLLDGFVYIDNPQQKGPKEAKLSHNCIRSYYDGFETDFCCYRGKWLVRQID